MKIFLRKFHSKDLWRNLAQWIEKRGFYISLILCIGIICVSTLFVTTSEIGKMVGFEEQLPDNSSIYEDLGETKQVQSFTTPIPVKSPKPSVVNVLNAESKPKNKAATSISVKTDVSNEVAKKSLRKKYAEAKPVSNFKNVEEQKNVSFAKPLNGEILVDFAKDSLVYSKTLNEWRSHLGVDLKADKGTPVSSIADGIIKEVKTDPRYGVTIKIEHINGWESVYSNLLKSDMTMEGKKVKQGTVIGGVGSTANFESLDPAHVHLELYYKGKLVDPKKHLDIEK